MGIADDITDIHLGDVLAQRYALTSALGSGGMAVVYRASDRVLQREVAVKIMRRDISTSEAVIRRFLREAQRMASLDSPHLVPIYDAGRDGELIFLVMKLLEGPTLHEVIYKGKRLSVPRAVGLVMQVLDGLAHLHERNIIHRDIKPSNVIVTAGDKARLLDLGIARTQRQGLSTPEGGILTPPASPTTEDVALVGTPAYMAPERVLERNVDHRSDLYAVGILLYEALTRTVPLEGKTDIETCLKQINERPPDPRTRNPELPDTLVAVMMRALEKEPDRRYQSSQDFQLALNVALGRATGDPIADPTLEVVSLVRSSQEELDREFESLGRAAELLSSVDEPDLPAQPGVSPLPAPRVSPAAPSPALRAPGAASSLHAAGALTAAPPAASSQTSPARGLGEAAAPAAAKAATKAGERAPASFMRRGWGLGLGAGVVLAVGFGMLRSSSSPQPGTNQAGAPETAPAPARVDSAGAEGTGAGGPELRAPEPGTTALLATGPQPTPHTPALPGGSSDAAGGSEASAVAGGAASPLAAGHPERLKQETGPAPSSRSAYASNATPQPNRGAASPKTSAAEPSPRASDAPQSSSRPASRSAVDDPLAAPARARLEAGDTAGALRLLDAAILEHPDRASLYRLRGDTYTRIGNQDAARAAYRQADRLGTSNSK